MAGIDQRQLTLGPRLLTSSEDTRRRDLMVMVMRMVIKVKI